MREVDNGAKGCRGHAVPGQDLERPRLGQVTKGAGVIPVALEHSRGQRRHAGASEWLSVSPQETSIPEELMLTVVKPGLPTLADLHVLLPPPRPTRKRSLTSDKVPPTAAGSGVGGRGPEVRSPPHSVRSDGDTQQARGP